MGRRRQTAAGGSNDHGALNGLLDDDHTQYPLRTLLANRGEIAFRGAAVWEALAVGSAGQILRSGGAGADISWVTHTYPDFAAGSVRAATMDTEESDNSGAYVKAKDSEVGLDGTISTSFDIKTSVATQPGKGRVYRDGVAVGTERSNNTTNYVNYTEDIGGWTAGEDCELWIDSTAIASVFCRNFRLSVDALPVITVLDD